MPEPFEDLDKPISEEDNVDLSKNFRIIYKFMFEMHDVVADPTESINLAASRPQLLQQMIAAFEEYQKGAVPDLADVRGCGAGGAVGCDPAANPALRADKAWGPFTDSKRCEWL